MHSYYLMHKNSKPFKEASPNRIFEYKCNQNFQRMLRIKEKIRKKHIVSVSKQKQKYSEQ